MLEENDYAMPVQTLQSAKTAGKLTPTGEWLMVMLG